MISGNLGVANDGDLALLGGIGSFTKRMARKTVNVAKDVARPVTAAARGDFDTAGRAFGRGLIAPSVTLVKVAQQAVELKPIDIEKARDVGIRQTEKLASQGMVAIRSAIKKAITPVVSRFLHGTDEVLLGSDGITSTSKNAIKTKATAAALPVAISAGSAAGSAIPGVGTATGAATATAITPGLVSEIVDDLWSKGKRAASGAASSVAERSASASESASKGAAAAAAAAAFATREQKQASNRVLLFMGAAIVGYVLLGRRKA